MLGPAQSQCGGCGQACGEIGGQALALKQCLTQQLEQMGAAEQKRTYLIVVDDSEEARVALRFAARRAAKTNGRVEVLGIVEAQDFVQFGGVQAAIEQEQRLRIEGVVSSSIGEILDESGVEANIIVQQGEVVRTVRDYLAGRDDVAALVLGPFQGRAACIRIAFGSGVCGVAAQTRATQLVEDVNAFPGHIACDSASASELVVPIVRDGELIAVLDIDSPRTGRFTAEDEAGCVRLAEILAKAL